jgi:hypothetical protein
LTNPWLLLPTEPPLVLQTDALAVNTFNRTAKPEKQYDLSLLPEPFFGHLDAPIVLLALNPGLHPSDAVVHAQKEFVTQARRSLSHNLAPYPFLHLQPESSTPGAFWWRRIAGPLIQATSFEVVAKGILCVQYFPYHSRSFSPSSPNVPSQQYSWNLVRSAIERNAEIVVMRSWRLWASAVPELATHTKVHHVRNPRNPSLSAGNLGASFEALKSKLSEQLSDPSTTA